MISLKRKQSGFTIVELLIVIVVIGILATLVIVTFTGIQQKARDTKRKTDINALDSHLEAYYANNGYYPTYAHFSDTTGSGGNPSWISVNMKGLDPSAEQDPKGDALAAGDGTTSAYGYKVTCTDSSDETTCTSFVLTAHLEAGGTYTKQSN